MFGQMLDNYVIGKNKWGGGDNMETEEGILKKIYLLRKLHCFNFSKFLMLVLIQ